MKIPARLTDYLVQRGARYQVCAHDHSQSSAQTARLAHIPQHQLVKSVILEDDRGCVLAVVPADSRVQIGELARLLGRRDLHLADERRIAQVFEDCVVGAVPAFGMAWGVETVVDETIGDSPEVYVEAGDHEAVLRMSREQFDALMGEAKHGRFCRPPVH